MGKKYQSLHISSILNGVFGTLGLSNRLKQQQALKLWAEVVGPEISAVTWPLEFSSKEMRVLVNDPIWMQQLVFLEPKIIDKINSRLSTMDNQLIEKIYFQVGIPPKNKATEGRKRLRESLDLLPEEVNTINETVNNLSNPELKEILKNFFKKALLADKKRGR